LFFVNKLLILLFFEKELLKRKLILIFFILTNIERFSISLPSISSTSPETMGPSPETMGPSPKTMGASPKTMGPSPETMGPSPETMRRGRKFGKFFFHLKEELEKKSLISLLTPELKTEITQLLRKSKSETLPRSSLVLPIDSDGQLEEILINTVSAFQKTYQLKFNFKPITITGLTGMVMMLIESIGRDTRSRTINIYRRIFQHFKSDLEINSNWGLDRMVVNITPKFFKFYESYKYEESISLLKIINEFGEFEDFLYLLNRPDFKWPDGLYIRKFNQSLINRSQITKLIEVLKRLMISRGNLPLELKNSFGFIKTWRSFDDADEDEESDVELEDEEESDIESDENESEVDSDENESEVDSAEDEEESNEDEEVESNEDEEVNDSKKSKRWIGTHSQKNKTLDELNFGIKHFLLPNVEKKLKTRVCCSCSDTINANEISCSGPALCKCHFHVECALNLVVSYISQISDPNPLARKIISCPGCQGEIVPSFIIDIRKHLTDFKTLLEIYSGLPQDFLKTAKNELLKLVEVDLNQIDQAVAVLYFKRDPKFVICPKNGCHGFALIDPDQEINTKCLICHKNSLFIGSQRQIEIQKDAPEIIQLLKTTKTIRPCTRCGKLIEKLDGCNSMHCTFCNTGFDWERAGAVDAMHSELTIHF